MCPALLLCSRIYKCSGSPQRKPMSNMVGLDTLVSQLLSLVCHCKNYNDNVIVYCILYVNSRGNALVSAVCKNVVLFPPCERGEGCVGGGGEFKES